MVGLCAAFRIKCQQLPLNVCFRGAFLADVPFLRLLIKFLSLPSQTRPNFAGFFIYCSIAIAAALFLRAYFALLFCRRHTAWGSHDYSFFCSRLLSTCGRTGAVAAMPAFFIERIAFAVFICMQKKSAPRSGRQKFNTSKNYIFLRFQMSSAYSLIVRSDEKRPMRAVLSIAIFAQRGLSLKASSAFFWASQ